MAEDIRENQMPGGTPAKIRGLDANGNSIAPTMGEVAKALPLATTSSKGLMSATDRLNLRAIDVQNSTSKSINLGRIYGLFRFVLWSDTNSVALYLIDAIGKSIVHVAGYNISGINYSFTVDSNENLILNYNGSGAKTTHIKGLAEAFR